MILKSIVWMKKCGMQALERAAPDLPAARAKYAVGSVTTSRHGTQSLMAALHVATGRVSASIDQTRTESNFVSFIEWVVGQTASSEKIVFVLDQLNTHKSESLVF